MIRLRLFPLVLALAAACAGSQPAEPLEDLPQPVLDGLDEEVRAQLGEAHQRALRMRDGSLPLRERAEALGRLGSLYLAYQLPDAARVSFRNARRLEPKETRWAYYLGTLEQERGELEAARELFREVRSRQPGDAAAGLRLGTVLLESGRTEEAEGVFREVLAQRPRSGAAHFGLGRAAAVRGDHQRAVESFQRALQLQPEATQVHYALAQSYRRLGDLEQARRHLEQRGEATVGFADPLMSGLASLTAGAPGHAYRGDQAVLAGRFEEAAREYRRAVQLAPQSFFYRQSLGLTLHRLGQIEEAAEAMRQAVKLAPGGVQASRAHFTLGGTLANQNRLEQARLHFEEALRLDASNLEARFELGRLAGRAGRLEEALEHFTRVLAARPDHLEALRLAATTQMDLGRFSAALPHLEQLIELEPDNPRNRWLLEVATQRANP